MRGISGCDANTESDKHSACGLPIPFTSQIVHVDLAFLNCRYYLIYVSRGGENVHAATLQTDAKWLDITYTVASYCKCNQELKVGHCKDLALQTDSELHDECSSTIS